MSSTSRRRPSTGGRRLVAALTALTLGGLFLVAGAGAASAEDGGDVTGPAAVLGDVECWAEGGGVPVLLDNSASAEATSFGLLLDGVDEGSLEVPAGATEEAEILLGEDGTYAVTVVVTGSDPLVTLLDTTVEVACAGEEPPGPGDGDVVDPGDILDVAWAAVGQTTCTEVGTEVEVTFELTAQAVDRAYFRVWVDGEQTELTYGLDPGESRTLELVLGPQGLYDVAVTATFDHEDAPGADLVGEALVVEDVAADCDFEPVADPRATLEITDTCWPSRGDETVLAYLTFDNSRSNVASEFTVEAVQGEIVSMMGGNEDLVPPGAVHSGDLVVRDGTKIQVTARSSENEGPRRILVETLTVECAADGEDVDSGEDVGGEDQLADTGLETVHVVGVALGLVALGTGLVLLSARRRREGLSTL